MSKSTGEHSKSGLEQKTEDNWKQRLHDRLCRGVGHRGVAGYRLKAFLYLDMLL